jgi:hypothetical protein
MDKSLHRLAFALRWFAVFWPVVWALYVTHSDNSYFSSMNGMIVTLATLLIPAALAYGLSWGLDRFPTPKREPQRPLAWLEASVGYLRATHSRK